MRGLLAVFSLLSISLYMSIAASAAPGLISFETHEGTWLSVTAAPDGRELLFDLLGDIYRLPMSGGTAQPVLTGASFDTQPVFSPTGSHFAFISDRSGSENVWIADANGTNMRALSHDADAVFVSPAWSADGRSIYVTRFSSRSRLDSEIQARLWVFDLGGGGKPLTDEQRRAQAAADSDDADSGDEYSIEQPLGAALSPDGRFLYFSATGRRGKYDIVRRDLHTGDSIILISGAARDRGLLQPVISPSGTLLAYAVDVEGRTQLRLRNLLNGDDRELLAEIENSLANMTPAFQGLLPHYGFTADSSAIVIAYGGQIRYVNVANGAARVIPFNAMVQMDAAPRVETPLLSEAGPVRSRIIQGAQLAPDGRRLAFSAFGKVYVVRLPGGKARRLTSTPLSEDAMTENQPAWSPDGRWITFTSWSSSAGGHLWKIRSTGEGTPERLTRQPGYYRKPVFTPDGRAVVALYSSVYDRVNLLVPRGWNPELPAAQELVRVPSAGGDRELLAELPPSVRRTDHGRIQFMAGVAREHDSGVAGAPEASMMIYTSEGLLQMPLQGGATRQVLQVFGANVLQRKAAVDDLALSPDRRWALVLQNFQLYLLALPSAGTPAQVDLNAPAVGLHRITEIGADEFGWSADGKQVYWTVGSSLFRVPLQRLLQRPDIAAASTTDCSDDEFERVNIDVTLPRELPDGSSLLCGARVLTMKGDQSIENADILIRGNRIAALGARGSITVPDDAMVLDFSGKTITPGFSDSHAHYWRIGRQVLDYDNWEYRIALAYGITTSLDPQSFTTDMFVYQDLLDAGVMRGPRAYTTGPGIFEPNHIASVRQGKCILRRYRDHYRTSVVKSYMIGSRSQRQQMAQAARELGMRLVTENWGVPRYALTQAMDGFATNEHASDAIDYFDDIAQLYARTGIGYSPTTLIGGAAGLPGINYFLTRRDLLNDEKLNRFTPRRVLDERLRGVTWLPQEQFIIRRLAESAARIARAGGHVSIGGHSELQGLGYHFEMQALAQGLRPREVLEIATRGTASVLGRATESGSLEPGKYADLLVFERDPSVDITNTESLTHVMKNGRLFEASTLREINPAPAPRH